MDLLDTLAEVVKGYLMPGSSFFLLAGMTLAILLRLLGGSKRREWLVLLLALSVLYWSLSVPRISSQLEAGLDRGFVSLSAEADPPEVDAIVVLGGGSATYRSGAEELDVLSDASALRALEAARIYKRMAAPLVVVSGGTGSRGPAQNPDSSGLRSALIELGVPADRIIEESESRNTYEQAVLLRDLLPARGAEEFVLVTSRSHMWRSVRTFEAQGLNPIPSVAPDRSEGWNRQAGLGLIPSTESLQTSQVALREYFGLVYYSLRGWLSLP